MVSGIDLFWGLFNNLALFIVLVAVYGLLIKRLADSSPMVRQVVVGVIFGLFAFACMHVKIPVAKGVIVDQRNTIVALSATFGGPWSGLFSAIMTGGYRAYLGGAGALGGIIGVGLSVVAGTIVGKMRRTYNTDNKFMAIPISLGATVLILPGFLFYKDLATGWALLKAMALPYGSAVFIGIMFCGLLLSNEEHRYAVRLAQEKSEKRYRELFENLIDVSYRTDDQGVIEVMSPSAEQIFGYPLDEVIGKKIIEFYNNPADRERFAELLQQNGRVYGFEAEIKRKDGGVIWVSTNAKPLLDRDGKFAGVEGITRDITRQKESEEQNKKLEEQLRHSQKMEAMGVLAGGIAHDFNNILSAIFGYAELAVSNADKGSENIGRFEEILKAADRAKGLVTQILTFSRKVEPELKLTDLNVVVRQTERMLARTIPKMIRIETKLSPDLWRTYADVDQLTQVLMNLGTNARDAMPEGGRLVFETENVVLDEEYCRRHAEVSPGEFILLTVSDTGQGMDRDTQEHIFDPFFTSKEAGRGTGLGLSIVYGVVKNHNGLVMCYSEVGQGSAFKVYLPAVLTDDEVEVSGRPAAFEAPGGRESILLVDDEEAIRQVGWEILTSKGYDVTVAESGEQAVEIFRSRKPLDLIILDINMPGMGGRKSLEEFFRIDPGMKVIITSGYSLAGPAGDAMKAGAAGFVPKPFTMSDLLKAVRDALDGTDPAA